MEKKTDKNGLPLLPDLIEIDLVQTFDHEYKGPPIMVKIEMEKILEEADQELEKCVAIVPERPRRPTGRSH